MGSFNDQHTLNAVLSQLRSADMLERGDIERCILLLNIDF